MLVVTRKTDEIIRIGDDITIMVVDIRGDKVRLGIDAPSYVGIHRQEVWLAIKEQEAKAKEVAEQNQTEEQKGNGDEW